MVSDFLKKALKGDVDTIAQIIAMTPIEFRGDLLNLVADELSSCSQNFTASVIRGAAQQYKAG